MLSRNYCGNLWLIRIIMAFGQSPSLRGQNLWGEWTKGSDIRFINEDGKESGMLSEIAESSWPELISIKHRGVVINGDEDYDSPLAREWSGGFETYRFIPQKDGSTIFSVEQDLLEAYAEEFTANWGKSFDRMAALIETDPDFGKIITLRERSSCPPEEIWERLVTPEKVMTWNYASDDWYSPAAENNLEVGGEFHYEMTAKDGSESFDFWGTYTEIEAPRKLSFVLSDRRTVSIDISEKPYGSLMEEGFEAEKQNDMNLPRQGWQNILKNLVR